MNNWDPTADSRWKSSKHPSKCLYTGLWTYPGKGGVPHGSPLHPMGRGKSLPSANRKRNCPTTCSRDKQCGGQRRQYHTAIQDTITKYKVHMQFSSHKASRNFVNLIQGSSRACCLFMVMLLSTQIQDCKLYLCAHEWSGDMLFPWFILLSSDKSFHEFELWRYVDSILPT